jgi:hypothetical protein
MSILRRARDRLPLGELANAWAMELNAPAIDLVRLFLDDLMAGTLDGAGPTWMVTAPDGPRRNVTSNDLERFIAEHGHAGWVSAAAARSLQISEGYERPDWAHALPDDSVAADAEWYFWRQLIVSRQIALIFAERRGLRAPSWWGRLGSDRSSPSDDAPVHTTPSGIRTNRAQQAERECEDWIGKLTSRPENKGIAFRQAVAAVSTFGDLSQKAFDRAWANTAPPEWKTAGRRKRS